MKRALKTAARALPALITDALGLLGAGSVSYGSWLIFRPAGYIVAGLLLMLGAWLSARAAAYESTAEG